MLIFVNKINLETFIFDTWVYLFKIKLFVHIKIIALTNSYIIVDKSQIWPYSKHNKYPVMSWGG